MNAHIRPALEERGARAHALRAALRPEAKPGARGSGAAGRLDLEQIRGTRP